MPALVGRQGDPRPGAAGEDVGDAPNFIDGRLRVAGGDEDSHGGTAHKTMMAIAVSGAHDEVSLRQK